MLAIAQFSCALYLSLSISFSFSLDSDQPIYGPHHVCDEARQRRGRRRRGLVVEDGGVRSRLGLGHRRRWRRGRWSVSSITRPRSLLLRPP
jgi:hypothetical protein